MTRRLMHQTIDSYGKDPRVTKLVDSTEMWFLLSANPDGYDYTFTSDSARLWRKNLRDNNGDGKITAGDGVDPNRNFAYRWGYDNEGSSPNPSSETYRGPKASSEPETVALDTFEKRIGFKYAINYHSAAELLLYGVGWQVATPTPDDIAYKALAGTPENSAVPGYYPQVSSELYTTNGEADSQAANANGVMMFTPEMSTCQTASAVDPNDRWKPEDCASVFNFPDDEKLIQAEFAKNVPFALSVAESVQHPDQPKSSVGLSAADFTLDPFTTSYVARGEDQTVAVTARKALKDKELHFRISEGAGSTGDAPTTRTSGPGRAVTSTAATTTTTSTSTGPRSTAPSPATRSRSGSPAATAAASRSPASTSRTRWPSGRAPTSSWSRRRAPRRSTPRSTWTPCAPTARARRSGTWPSRGPRTTSACCPTSARPSTTRGPSPRAVPPSWRYATSSTRAAS